MTPTLFTYNGNRTSLLTLSLTLLLAMPSYNQISRGSFIKNIDIFSWLEIFFFDPEVTWSKNLMAREVDLAKKKLVRVRPKKKTRPSPTTYLPSKMVYELPLAAMLSVLYIHTNRSKSIAINTNQGVKLIIPDRRSFHVTRIELTRFFLKNTNFHSWEK